MAIPPFEQLMRPVLELAAKENIGRRSATDAMIRHFSLTKEEIDHRLPSGGSTIANRTGWAMTFLTKAALIAKVAPKTYAATEAGRAFLERHSGPITDADLRRIPGYKEAWAVGSAKLHKDNPLSLNSGPTEPLSARPGQTPHEVLGAAVTALDSDFRGRLLQTIVAQSPTFFEELVLDVLVAMGYGGSKQDAAERLGQSGDEGIDGCINQDALGLDQVMVQAKRYRPDRRVPQNEIREFIGSLTGKGVTKGIFITTSSFAGSAQDFVSRGSTTKVVLVDGAMLIDLMVRHSIGTRVAKEYKVHEIDQNYFENEE